MGWTQVWLRQVTRQVQYCQVQYHQSDIPQFLNLMSTTFSLHFKFNLRWERVCGCYRGREIFFCSLSHTREHSKENIPHCKHFYTNIWRVMITIVSILCKNMYGDLSLDIIFSWKLTVFQELHSQKTVCIFEEIMCTNKYPHIFLCQIDTIVHLCMYVRVILAI